MSIVSVFLSLSLAFFSIEIQDIVGAWEIIFVYI